MINQVIHQYKVRRMKSLRQQCGRIAAFIDFLGSGLVGLKFMQIAHGNPIEIDQWIKPL